MTRSLLPVFDDCVREGTLGVDKVLQAQVADGKKEKIVSRVEIGLSGNKLWCESRFLNFQRGRLNR